MLAKSIETVSGGMDTVFRVGPLKRAGDSLGDALLSRLVSLSDALTYADGTIVYDPSNDPDDTPLVEAGYQVGALLGCSMLILLGVYAVALVVMFHVSGFLVHTLGAATVAFLLALVACSAACALGETELEVANEDG